MDLSGVPATNLTLWNRYEFRDGPMEGLGIGGGLNWESSVKTSTPIGRINYVPGQGAILLPNLYPTPDRPSRFEFEAFVTYKLRHWLGADWSIQLNVQNLFNDTVDFVTAEYTNPRGGQENRRIEIIYPGRSFRLMLTAKF